MLGPIYDFVDSLLEEEDVEMVSVFPEEEEGLIHSPKLALDGTGSAVQDGPLVVINCDGTAAE